MNKQLLNRREFNGVCLALGSSFFSAGTMIVALSSASAGAGTPMVRLQISRRGDIRTPLRKKRCEPAFRSG